MSEVLTQRARRRCALAATLLGLAAFAWPGQASESSVDSAAALNLPFEQAGLTERQAAAHLLDRFAFGPRPGEVDELVEQGLSEWIEMQLKRAADDRALARRLQPLDALEMSAQELEATFADPSDFVRMQLRQQARETGEMPARGDGNDSGNQDSRAALYRSAVQEMEKKGLRRQREMTEQLFANKLLRAIYSENQLAEVLADFWFNHFNIDARKREARPYLLSFERDAIRPNVLGEFSVLLLATASHPSMLFYLDNARSRAEAGQTTTAEFKMGGGPASLRPQGRRGGRTGGGGRGAAQRRRAREMDRLRPSNFSGLNENYARELMELHTLGVDGGYTQDDVVDVARALSGWTYVPADGQMRDRVNERIPNQRMREYLGFVEREGFFFNAAFHDAEKKTVLGRELPAGRGIEDGLDVLTMLGAHPSTARFLSHKLAQRFVSDEPSEQLVAQLAAAYEQSSGNIASVLRAMVQTEEFWASRRQKIKSPMELVTSTVRALDARVRSPGPLARALEQLGQPLYRYPAPTGFPETSDHWVNTGGLLNRMNFGMEAAKASRMIRFDLLGLVGGEEPESLEQALRAFADVLMPYRDHERTVEALLPAMAAEDLPARIADRLETDAGASTGAKPGDDGMGGEIQMASFSTPFARTDDSTDDDDDGTEPVSTSASLDHIVGLLIGSPEFQRR